MNYIGSKLSLIEFIDNSINSVLNKNNDKRSPDKMTFADLFAGTGIVGASFKKKGYRIIANDMQYYSFALNKHLIENNSPLKFEGLGHVFPELMQVKADGREAFVLSRLQSLEGVEGFIYNNYCMGGTAGTGNVRQYFSDRNGKKCDAIRQKIEEWKLSGYINENEYFFLIAALVDSIDKFANTASVYGAFLKSLKRSAQGDLRLNSYYPVIESSRDNKVYNSDINALIREIEGDILYLDPPYNQRQYATNYHLLETIVRYDNPEVNGKTGLRNYDDQKSLYCSRVKAVQIFEDLIKNARFKYIFLSYNNEGIIPFQQIERIFKNKGKYEVFEMNYRRFKADRDENRNHKNDSTIEYLHCVTAN